MAAIMTRVDVTAAAAPLAAGVAEVKLNAAARRECLIGAPDWVYQGEAQSC